MEQDMEQTKKFNWFKMFWSGFTNMTTLGKTLWTLAIIKLIIMFFILKPFFFANFLNSKFEDNKDKADYVRQQLIDNSSERNSTEYKTE